MGRFRAVILRDLAVMVSLIWFGTFGCASRNVYDSLRFHQEMDCQKLQGADRDACMQKSGMSYDEYQRHLKEQDQRK